MITIGSDRHLNLNLADVVLDLAYSWTNQLTTKLIGWNGMGGAPKLALPSLTSRLMDESVLASVFMQ